MLQIAGLESTLRANSHFAVFEGLAFNSFLYRLSSWSPRRID
jgi:hypothetical protein